MRAGLIIGGLFLMVFGAVLLLTIIFGLIALLFEFIGLIMLIVGLFTSESERVIVTSSPQVTVYGTGKGNISEDTKYCSKCGAKNQENARFCLVCGQIFTQPISASSEEKTKILAICPECKNRIASNSKFCPECGASLQPLKK